MRRILQKLKSCMRSEKGATMVEYGIIVALIAAVCIVGIQTVGKDISGALTKVGTSLTTAGVK